MFKENLIGRIHNVMAQSLNEWPIGRMYVFIAGAKQYGPGLAVCQPSRFNREPSFANARFARQQNNLTLTQLGCFPALLNDFLLPRAAVEAKSSGGKQFRWQWNNVIGFIARQPFDRASQNPIRQAL